MTLARRVLRSPQHLAGGARVQPRPRFLGTAAASSSPRTRPTTHHAALSPPQQPPLESSPSRREHLKNARPFSDFLTDTFSRRHTYLRISLTERCNLRCVYCMPEGGVPLSPPRELLTGAEIVLLSSVFVNEGVDKIRLTGGEPTVRTDIIPLMRRIGDLRRDGLRELCITTNGVALHRKLGDMAEAGLTGVNLSLDTLDPWQFQVMTRRRGLEAVLKSVEALLALNRRHGAGIKVKINCVVMRGVNDHEIPAFVEMTREQDLEVRFIEYMPFGGNRWSRGRMVGYGEMLDRVRQSFPAVARAAAEHHANDTSKAWRVPGFVGSIGFITSMTTNFCATCNRLRITSDGNLKVCLFGNAEVSLRDILRQINGGEPLDEDAFEAWKKATAASPPPSPHTQRLLDVIGMAVNRKKAQHAGMADLEHMKNRPMILIGG